MELTGFNKPFFLAYKHNLHGRLSETKREEDPSRTVMETSQPATDTNRMMELQRKQEGL
jgi:hypothetical protein